MSRVRSVLIAGLIVAGVGLTAGVAQAQTATTNYPPTSVTTAASTTTTTTSSAGGTITALTQLVPGQPASFLLTDADFVVPQAYNGTLQSTTVAIPTTAATTNGQLRVTVTLPADFALNATHRIIMKNATTGTTVFNDTFYADANGRISAAPSSNLPKTGSDYIDPALKAGGALLAAGALVLLVARRRRTAATPAA